MTEIEHNGTVAMTDDGGSAFPLPVSTDLDGREAIAYPGMSLRDWFAGQAQVPWNAAMETLALAGDKYPTLEELAAYRAKMKYIEADAMIKARKGDAP